LVDHIGQRSFVTQPAAVVDGLGQVGDELVVCGDGVE